MKQLIILFLLTFGALYATAQTKVQRGIVRKLTRYPNDKIVPVQGVCFVVTGTTDVRPVVSDANGKFSLSVNDNKDHKFSLAAVRPNTYKLFSPMKGEAIGLHPEHMFYVVVYTPDENVAFIKKERDEYKKKNEKLRLRIQTLLEERKEKLQQLSESDAQYTKVKAERDSLQRLYTEYIENSENEYKIVDEITEKLALVDYLSLDSIDRKIYELKCTGEWKKISDFINEQMNGNVEDELLSIQAKRQQVKAKEQQKRNNFEVAMQENQETDNELAKWFARMEDYIESLKMQHLNDSVSHCYALLVKADSTNWDYLNKAGQWEEEYRTRHKAALDYYFRALACTNQDTLKVKSYNNIGDAYSYQDKYDEALSYYNKALEIAKPIFGENHPDVATSYNNMGGVYFSQVKCGKALASINKALNIRKSVFGEQHPKVAESYSAIGGIYYDQGDSAKAEDFIRKALKIRESVLDEHHPALARSYNDIGVISRKKGNYTEALKYEQKSLEIKETVFGEKHPDVATSYNNIGLVYSSQSNYAEALKNYEKALEIDKFVNGENHSDVATDYSNMGYIYP